MKESVESSCNEQIKESQKYLFLTCHIIIFFIISFINSFYFPNHHNRRIFNIHNYSQLFTCSSKIFKIFQIHSLFLSLHHIHNSLYHGQRLLWKLTRVHIQLLLCWPVYPPFWNHRSFCVQIDLLHSIDSSYLQIHVLSDISQNIKEE